MTGTHVTPLTQNILLDSPKNLPLIQPLIDVNDAIIGSTRDQLRENFLKTVNEVKNEILTFLETSIVRQWPVLLWLHLVFFTGVILPHYYSVSCRSINASSVPITLISRLQITLNIVFFGIPRRPFALKFDLESHRNPFNQMRMVKAVDDEDDSSIIQIHVATADMTCYVCVSKFTTIDTGALYCFRWKSCRCHRSRTDIILSFQTLIHGSTGDRLLPHNSLLQSRLPRVSICFFPFYIKCKMDDQKISHFWICLNWQTKSVK